MAYVDIVTALAVLQFVVFGFRVGRAREQYGVKAPAVVGNEVFERYFRIQQNTLEQLIVFLPGLYIYTHYWNPVAASILGAVYLIGREIYAAAYVKQPSKRTLGFALTFLPIVILVIGGLLGAVMRLAGH
jgi:uncharacterized membrane protein YecN with MAPEG domain